MRALRSSLYVSPLEPPMTTVLLESYSRDTLESARVQLLQPGAFVVHEIFESADDVQTATHEAAQRAADNMREEFDQAMLYHWTLHTWGSLKEGGTMFMDKPTPLTRAAIEVVFDQLAQHPDYKHFTIVSHTEEGERVTMVDGKIKEG